MWPRVPLYFCVTCLVAIGIHVTTFIHISLYPKKRMVWNKALMEDYDNQVWTNVWTKQIETTGFPLRIKRDWCIRVKR